MSDFSNGINDFVTLFINKRKKKKKMNATNNDEDSEGQ